MKNLKEKKYFELKVESIENNEIRFKIIKQHEKIYDLYQRPVKFRDSFFVQSSVCPCFFKENLFFYLRGRDKKLDDVCLKVPLKEYKKFLEFEKYLNELCEEMMYG